MIDMDLRQGESEREFKSRENDMTLEDNECIKLLNEEHKAGMCDEDYAWEWIRNYITQLQKNIRRAKEYLEIASIHSNPQTISEYIFKAKGALDQSKIKCLK